MTEAPSIVELQAKIEQLKAMLQEVGRWDCQGRSVAEQFDLIHGAGSWRRAVRFSQPKDKE